MEASPTAADDPAVLAALQTLDSALDTTEAWEANGFGYAAHLGLTEEHLPSLVRIMRLWVDDSYWEQWRGDKADDPALFAPVHAWRALGHIGGAAAAEALVTMIRPLSDNDDDWLTEEFCDVIARVGNAAIKPLEPLLFDTERGERAEWARVAVGSSLEKVAARHPETREEIVGLLTRKVSLGRDDSPMVVGFAISELIDLKAVESAEVIERAFDLRAVDHSINGNWFEVQKSLGLAPPRPTPEPGWGEPHAAHTLTHAERSRQRAKKKQQRKNKKRNRR